jgi:hypothetical protein
VHNSEPSEESTVLTYVVEKVPLNTQLESILLELFLLLYLVVPPLYSIRRHSYLLHIFAFFSFLGSTAQLRPWPPPQNPAEFLGGFSKIFFFAG